MTQDLPKDVSAAFAAFPPPERALLTQLRSLILDCAEQADDVGEIAEVLRWGQPTYIAPKGSMLRLGVPKGGGVAIYAHCQTDIISTFAARFPTEFEIEGNRAVHLTEITKDDQDKLRLMILHALRYKLAR